MAVVAETFLPAVNGVTNSVLRVIEHLTAAGHDPTVIAPGPGGTRIGAVDVVRVRAFDVPRSGQLRVGFPTARINSILRDLRPDVIHLAAPAVLGAAAVRAARRFGIPTVAVYQTDLAGFIERYGAGWMSEHVWSWIARLHRQADLSLAPSSTAVWALRTRGVDQVALWGRGVDAVRFSPEHRSNDLRRWLAPNDEVVVGYVGRLAREKQIELLAPLARRADIRLLIVGDGPERSRLERAMPGAVFVGHQDGARLGQFHASIDVFVHAGIDETFCQSIQEAMASGVPVVAPAAGGPLDLVRHGITGYLWTPDRPGTLVAAVDDLVASPVRRAAMGSAGRNDVAPRTWASVVDELVGHYRRTIEPPTERRWAA